MSMMPLVQFKAGLCEIDDGNSPWKVKPKASSGFIYLYRDEDLAYLCWRRRAMPLDNPGEDSLHLSIPPGDGRFEPYQPSQNSTNGRIYRLSFESSNAKHFFWLQSKSQHPEGKADHWSERDYSLGKIVNEILNGEDVDPNQLYQNMGDGQDGQDGDEESDAEMRDASNDDPGQNTGGTGAGLASGKATGAEEESRRSGEDGPRTNLRRQTTESRTQTAVANLLRSLQNDSRSQTSIFAPSSHDELFTTLPELLRPEHTCELLENLDDVLLDDLLAELPTQLISMEATKIISEDNDTGPVSLSTKKNVLSAVLRSPQFVQSLASLTNALRDGGLPTISNALDIKVPDGGYVQKGRVPMAGDTAVRAFIEGVRNEVLNTGGGLGGMASQ